MGSIAAFTRAPSVPVMEVNYVCSQIIYNLRMAENFQAKVSSALKGKSHLVVVELST